MIQGKSGLEKAQFVMDVAAKHGWTSDGPKHVKKDDVTTLRVERRAKTTEEFVEIRWDGNSCKEMPIVCFNGQLRYVRNVAAAIRVIEASAKSNAVPFEKRLEAKAGLRKAAPVKRAPGKTSKLPFSPEDDEATIKSAVLGKRIVWRNRISGEFEEDVVSTNRNSKHFGVKKGQLSFVGAYGFRTIRIEDIAAVRA